MNTKIVSKTDNALFGRKEIKAEISFSGATPSRDDLRKDIAAKIGANPDLLVLREVNSTFGRQIVTVVAHAYDEKQKLLKTEPSFVLVRDKLAEEKPKEAAAKPAPAKK